MATSLTITTILDDITPVQRTALGTFISGSVVAGEVTPLPTLAVLAAPAVVDYFPADPAKAPFPSPENASILRLPDRIAGAPYILDVDGSEHMLVAAPAGTSGYTVNGTMVKMWDPSIVIVHLLQRQGRVRVQQNGGQWSLFNPAMGGCYPDTPPDVWPNGVRPTPEQAKATALAVAVAAIPAPYSPAPGSSGRILTAVPGQIATVLATAQDGDTLRLDGQYAEDVPAIAVALKVELAAGTVVDFTHQHLAQGKGGFVPLRDFWLDGPGTIIGAGILETVAGGTAAIRHGAPCNVKITGSPTLKGHQNGLGMGDFPGCTLDVDGLILDGNGLGDGYTHNAYIFGNMARVRIKNMISRNPKVGHDFKTRCPDNVLENCTFEDAPAGVYMDDSSCIDLSDGGKLDLVNCTISKPAHALNYNLFGLSPESAKNGPGVLTMTGGTLNAMCDTPGIAGANGATATFTNVTVVGTKPVGKGVVVTGL